MQPFVQTIVKGYHIQEIIDHGGFGSVYKAYQPTVNREVAIKVILPAYANQIEFIRQFEAEAHLIARLEHPYIVPLYDYWRDPEGAYLVMRYFARGTVSRALTAGQSFDLPTIARLMEQVTSALALAHRHGVIHRDIKPGNLFLDEEGNTYLGDFGIAKTGTGKELSAKGFSGSLAYAAPELLQAKSATPQSDIYSLGYTLYELLTGSHPLKDYTIPQLLDHHLHEALPPLPAPLPAALNVVIQTATAKNPAQRYANVQEASAAFYSAIAAQPIYVRDEVLENPYKGLRAFEEADTDDFFGRTDLVQHLLETLRIQQRHFLALVGPSGSGKSSLVKAGLVPQLRQGALNNSQNWFYLDMTPSADPIEALAAALRSVIVTEEATDLKACLAERDGLHKIVKEKVPAEQVVLFIDQFEELFTLVEDEKTRTHFLDLLVTTVSQPDSRVHVILTLRADFYDRPLLHSEFAYLMQQCTSVVVPLNAKDLERAIVGPVEKFNVRVDNDLVAAIITDIKEEPGALPLLQYALTEVFEQRQDNTLALKVYQAIGGVKGALIQRAEELYNSLTPDLQKLTEQLFLRLVTLGEGKEDTRRRVHFSELVSAGQQVADLNQVIERFSKYRLLTLDRDPQTREPTVEVAHEALIQEWERLKLWLDQNRQGLRMQRSLAALAEEWAKGKRDHSFLLQGVRLIQFNEWAAETPLHLSDLESAYLTASQQEHTHQIEIETTRQQRENDLKRQSVTRLRMLLGAVSVALAIAVSLSLLALNQSAQAEKARANSETNARTAENNLHDAWGIQSRILSDLAQQQLAAGAAQTGLLLALEAVDHYPIVQNDESYNALHAAAANPIQELGYMRLSDNELNFGVGGAAWDSTYQRVLMWTDVGELSVWSPRNPTPIVFRHQARIGGAAWSADEQHILSWSDDGTARIWSVADQTEVFKVDQKSPIIGAAWNADQSEVLLWATDGSIQIWDIAAQVKRYEFKHDAQVRGVRWSADERRLLSWSEDGTARIWTLDSEADPLVFSHASTVEGAIWSADEQRLLTWTFDGQVEVWEVPTGESVLHVQHGLRARGARWNKDESAVLSWAEDGIVRLSYLDSDQPPVIFEHPEGVVGVRWMADETRILTWTKTTSYFYIWSLADNETPLLMLQHNNLGGEYPNGILTADETRLLTAGGNALIQGWDIETGLATGEAPLLFTIQQWGMVTGMRLNPDETQLLTWSNDDSARIWALRPQTFVHQLPHDQLVRGAHFSQDEQSALTWSNDHTVRIWQLFNAQPPLVLHHDSSVVGAVWNQAENRVLSWTLGGAVWEWDLAHLDQPATYQLDAPVSGAAWDHQEKQLLAWTQNGSLYLWNEQRATPLHMQHNAPIVGARWNLADQQVLVWDRAGTVRVWDAASGEERLHLDMGSLIGGAQWNPDESLIWAWSLNGKVNAWDATSGAVQLEIVHAKTLKSAQWNYDFSRILTASVDGLARIWDAASGQLLAEYNHGLPLGGALWSPDEQLVLGWDESPGKWGPGTAFVWNPASQQLIRSAFTLTRPYTGAAWLPDGSGFLTWGFDSIVRVWQLDPQVPPLTLAHNDPSFPYEEGIWSVQPSTNSHYVLTVPSDKTARLWVIDLPTLMTVAHQQKIRDLQPNEREIAFLSLPETATEEITPATPAVLPTDSALLTTGTIVPTALPIATATPDQPMLTAQTRQAVTLISNPQPDFPAVMQLAAAEPMTVIALQDEWAYIQYKAVYGWLALSDLTLTGNTESIPAAETLGLQLCEVKPGAAFAETWAQAHWRLGCPTGDATSILSTAQPFLNGIMTWRSDTRNIFVILHDGQWTTYADTWQPNEAITCAGYYLALGFGKIYCNNPEAQQLLGVALGPEHIVTLTVQVFEHGSILESLDLGRLTLFEENHLIYEK